MPEYQANRSPVAEVPAADSATALAHFEALLGFETDCWDVHESLASGKPGFVLLDVRGPERFREGHVPGAVSLPHLVHSPTAIWLSTRPIRSSSSTAPVRSATAPTKRRFDWRASAAR